MSDTRKQSKTATLLRRMFGGFDRGAQLERQEDSIVNGPKPKAQAPAPVEGVLERGDRERAEAQRRLEESLRNR